MTYYQILKQRRLDLNLSVQDISIHTHLAPEYIRAIENHNLDVFSDDFSFVRYFVHSYCDAIGVNWEAVVREVDADISAYARMRDQALTAAQRRMVQTMPSASQKKTTRKKKKNRFVNSAASLSRRLNLNSSNRMSRGIVLVAVVGLAALLTLSSIMDAVNAKNRENAQIEKRNELQQKEKETQMLAEGRKNQKDSKNQENLAVPQIRAEEGTNTFYVAGLISDTEPMKISLTLQDPSAVSISANGVMLAQENVRDQYSYDAAVETTKEITVDIESWKKGDTLQINGRTLSLQTDSLKDGSQAVITLHVVTTLPEKETDKTDGSSENQSAGENQDQTWQNDGTGTEGAADPYSAGTDDYSGVYDYSGTYDDGTGAEDWTGQGEETDYGQWYE